MKKFYPVTFWHFRHQVIKFFDFFSSCSYNRTDWSWTFENFRVILFHLFESLRRRHHLTRSWVTFSIARLRSGSPKSLNLLMVFLKSYECNKNFSAVALTRIWLDKILISNPWDITYVGHIFILSNWRIAVVIQIYEIWLLVLVTG